MAKPNQAKDIDGYISQFPADVQAILQKVRTTISSAAPEAKETISYTEFLVSKRNGALVWFAGFSEHRSLFPTASVIEAFKKELKNLHTSKGTIAILRIHRSLFSMELPRTLKLVIGKFCNW